MKNTGPREWLLRALLVITSVSLTAGAVELALRVLIDRYRCDDRLGWTYRPDSSVLVFNWSGEFVHFVRFNRDGLREDREPPSGSDPAVYRIVVLGDSFSAGLQVPAEESFSELLESRLGRTATSGRRIEVWNAAVDGFGTAQALRMYIDRIASYRPDVVLLGLFLANDLGDNVFEGGGRNHYLATRCGRPYFQLDADGTVVESPSDVVVHQNGSKLDRFLRRSELYANLFPSTEMGSTFTDWDVFSARNAVGVEDAWRLTRALIRELDRQVQRNGGRLTVLLIPHEREARLGSKPGSEQPSALDFDRAHVLAGAFVREASIPYIDLYLPLRAAVTRGEDPYLNRDMHWNRRGHELVAESIEKWMFNHCAELSLPVEACMGSPEGAGDSDGLSQ